MKGSGKRVQKTFFMMQSRQKRGENWEQENYLIHQIHWKSLSGNSWWKLQWLSVCKFSFNYSVLNPLEDMMKDVLKDMNVKWKIIFSHHFQQTVEKKAEIKLLLRSLNLHVISYWKVFDMRKYFLFLKVLFCDQIEYL